MFSKDTLYTPPQKRKTKDKYADDKQWFKDCVDSYEYQALYYEQENHRKMIVHYNLDDGDVDPLELEQVFNPMGLDSNTFPSSIKHYPVAVPKIDLLVGEESKRRFDWSVRSQNNDDESNDATALLGHFIELAVSEIQNGNYSEQEAKKRIEEFARFAKYKFKDLNEITATKILRYLWRQYVIPLQFNKGFRHALVGRREIYRIDVEGEEPISKVCDPRNVFLIKQGDSEKIEDAEAIVEITYEPIGRIIDAYYDSLTPDDIDLLERGQWRTSTLGSSLINYSHKLPPIYSNLDFGNGPGFSDINDFNNVNFKLGLPYDMQGNVRVVRVRWIGRKKIGIVTFFDINGDEDTKVVSEYYKPDTSLGETVKWLWVNEAYEGTKIADSIYIKLQPRPIQMRHYGNKSKCFLGYVGTDYGKSLMSRMEPYQYLYDVYMNKLEMLFNKYKGPIYELDISKIPDDWEMDQWLYYADIMGWAVVDPFNEGKKGNSTGKLAGSFNTTGKVLDPKIGDIIQQTIMMLQYIEKQIGVISGVSEQRQGQIDNRETLGGVERAVTQSSHITEKWFFLHDETKKRVLAALLDTAKQLWSKTKNKKLSFIMDDMSREFVEFNGEDFASTEQDVFISNNSKDAEIREVIKQLSQAYVQNGAGSLVVELLKADSIAEMNILLKEAEDKAMQAAEQARKEENELSQMQAQIKAESEQAELDFKYYELESKLDVEYAKISASNDGSNTGSDSEAKAAFEERKQAHKVRMDERKQSEAERHNRVMEKKSMKPKTAN